MVFCFVVGIEKLFYPGLPPYNCWFSSLKMQNVLEVDYLAYQSYLKQGVPSNIALSNLGLISEPLPGQQTLEQLQREFVERGFRQFRDYLGFYLEFDILPFSEAASKLSVTFFKEFGIQIYRCHASIPSAAISVAFRNYLKDERVYIPSEETYKCL